MNKEKILVTGAAGFIGSNYVRMAAQKGYSVIGLDLLTYAGHRENLAGIGPNFELVVGDIRDPKLVANLIQKHRFSAILNFAAESHVDRSIDDPLVFVDTNVLGTANLLHQSLAYWNTLDSAEKKKFRYLQVSTDEVYGSLGETGKFKETTPLDPSSPYSSSKTGADLLVKAWSHTYGLPTITTRCSNNYGPYQYPEKLIPHMIYCALSGKDLPVYGDGKNIRDWIHVDDHCAGIHLALERAAPGSIYCFGGNAEEKNIDVVNVICKQLNAIRPRKDGRGYEEQIRFVKDRLGHDRRYAIDDSLAKKDLGFKQTHSFATGIQTTIKWYLDNEAWRIAVMGGEKK